MLFCCNQEIPETIKKKIGMVDSWWFTWKLKILIQLNKNLQIEINTKWKKWQRVVIQGVLTIKDRIHQMKNRQTWISNLQTNDWWPGKEFQNAQLTRNLRGPFSPLKIKGPVLWAWSRSMGDKHSSHTSVYTYAQDFKMFTTAENEHASLGSGLKSVLHVHEFASSRTGPLPLLGETPSQRARAFQEWPDRFPSGRVLFCMGPPVSWWTFCRLIKPPSSPSQGAESTYVPEALWSVQGFWQEDVQRG